MGTLACCRRPSGVGLIALVIVALTGPSVGAGIQLDLTDGFNTDAICGPQEYQECRTDGAQDHVELYGNLEDGNGYWLLSQGGMMVADSSTEPYSISGDAGHPAYVSGTEGLPSDGVLSGSDRDYHVGSFGGNDTLSGNWTESADPSQYDLKSNSVVVGSYHNTATWQVSSVTIELPSAQKGKYTDVNFVLCAANMADKARNMRIKALYGATGATEVTLYSFSTADGGDGPVMTAAAPTGFATVYTMSKYYNATSGATGNVVDATSRLFEFSTPLDLDETQDLWGFKIEDTNPSLNWNARGVAVFAATATPAIIQLDLTDGFNTDAICGPQEYQECRTDGAQDHVELYGNLEDGNGYWLLSQGGMMVADSSTEPYSISGDAGHPAYVSGTEGLPSDGVLSGSDRDYHVGSFGGNDTLSGNWTESADPSQYDLKSNSVVVGSYHNTATWQVSSVTIELPSAQKGKYTDVNFVLCAANMADKARNMRIKALYGATGATEVTLYSFSTADGGDGPVMTAAAPTGFATVYTMSKYYNATSGATGNVVDATSRLFEFSTPLDLDETQDLWGFKIEDTNPSLNWNARGVAVFAATAVTAGGSGGSNVAPTAVAGTDQTVQDSDGDGSESVTLDGTGSSDSDGTISSYVWKEGATQIATGSQPTVTLSAGTHTITLTVTDDDSATDTDTVVVTVNTLPVADAGTDQTVHDTDGGGTESVTLDGTGSTDSDGTIASYVWKEGATQIATGSQPSVALSTGTHTLTLEVTDNNSGTDTDTVVIIVNVPPVADAGADQQVEDTDDNGSQSVSLDGTGSSDSDGSISTYVWKNAGGTQIATGSQPSVSLTVGTHTLTLEVTDDDGGTDTDTVEVEVYEPSKPEAITLASAFNMDGLCGPKEYQECRTDGTQDLVDLFGDEADGQATDIADTGRFIVANSSTMPYSISGDAGHPAYLSGTDGLPADGELTGAGSRPYEVPSTNGSGLYSGDWTEVADPSNYDLKDNVIVVGSNHSTATWQISSVTIELASAKKGQYDNVNFVLAALDVADKARNMRIKALYGTDGSDEEVLYSFSTADGGDGPLMTDTSVTGFSAVYTMDKIYNSTSGSTGALISQTLKLWEFSTALDLNSGKTLWGFKIEDVNPSLNWNARGLAVFAVTAMTAAGSNALPVADAGTDQTVHDNDNNGSADATLDGTGSTDSDGTIASYVWTEGATQIATGSQPTVSLSTGVHTITLTVTDNDSGTDTDTVTVSINDAPVADAGSDQTVYDDDGNNSESVSLDGGGSSDSDGTIASYVWKEGATQIATGATPSVSLTVGTHTITLTVTDDDGATDTDTVVVVVSDNHLPVSDPGEDEVVEDTDDDGTVSVSLDGTGSTDSDGSISTYVWKNAAGTQIATGSQPTVSLGVGINDLTLEVTDDDSGVSTDVVRIWVMPKVDFWVDGTNGSDSNSGTSAQAAWATIDHAVDSTSVDGGEVIVVKGGTYREAVTLGRSGSSGSRITLMGYPFERVIVTGADTITGWTQCTSQIAKGNTNYANIYYVDLNWEPKQLIQDDQPMPKCRWPDNGWNMVEDGANNTLVDTTNLTQADDYWNGGTAVLWDMGSTGQYWKTISDFDSATGTLTISGMWTSNEAIVPEDNFDLYFIENKVEQINNAGEWAIEEISSGTWRVYYWAEGGGDPDSYAMEGSRRDRFVIEWGNAEYWVLDNLEVCYGVGSGMGTWGSGCDGYITVQNSIIRHNLGNGISGAHNDRGTYKNNLVIFNGSIGINNGGKSNVTFENNEIAYSGVDGLRTIGPNDGINWAENVTVKGNYIHGHVRWSHADNGQSYGGIRYLDIEDNVLIGGIQSYMMEGTDQATFTNNVILGASAISIINGHGNVTDTALDFNTICYSGLSMVNNSGDDGYDYTNNIFVRGNPGQIWGNIDSTTTYNSDYNCFWNGASITSNPITWPNTSTFAGYVSASGEDQNSTYADPKFTNVPAYFFTVNTRKHNLFTPTKVYIDSGDISYFSVGDHIEIDWDGTVRTVQSVGADYVTFSPGSDYIAFKCSQIINWKDKTDYNLDFTLMGGSPAIGGASDSSDMGSDINVTDYINGDFNGDGRRDIPVWPPAE